MRHYWLTNQTNTEISPTPIMSAAYDDEHALSLTTDEKGLARVLVKLRVYHWDFGTYQPPVLPQPATIRVTFQESGDKKKQTTAEIKVGLGLTLRNSQNDLRLWRD